MGDDRVTEVRVRHAVDQVALHQFDGQGRHVFLQINGMVREEHTRLRVGQVAVPFDICRIRDRQTRRPAYKFTCVGYG